MLFPNTLNLDLGTTESVVRCPGTVYYGFDVRDLVAEDIDVGENGHIVVNVPALHVQSVEPDLDAAEISTKVGWARLRGSSGVAQERRAITHIEEALRTQGRQHLADSRQPEVNAARALVLMLSPVLRATGVQDPQIGFRFETGRQIPAGTFAPSDG